MPELKTVKVELGHCSYDIYIGENIFDSTIKLLPMDLRDRNLFVVTDKNVEEIHASNFCKALNNSATSAVKMFVIPPGEQSKSFEQLQKLISWLLDNDVNRQSVIFALGGGVVGDLAGFAASTVMRGIKYVQVPTTLLAQTDSSVGGKTAINVTQGKNLVGSFHQPSCVLCDTSVLSTLPKRELIAGYAETLKYSLIGDSDFFLWLEQNAATLLNLDNEVLTHAISVACKKKAEIVRQDEKETGARALLNFGHTFAHILERAVEYDSRLLHGEAVSIGMVMAFQLSVTMGLCNEKVLERVIKHLKSVGLPVSIADIHNFVPKNAESLQESIKYDKKTTITGSTFILSRGIGEAFISNDVTKEDVLKVIEQSIKGE